MHEIFPNILFLSRISKTELALPKSKTTFLLSAASFRYSRGILWNNLKKEAKLVKSLGKFGEETAYISAASVRYFQDYSQPNVI